MLIIHLQINYTNDFEFLHQVSAAIKVLASSKSINTGPARTTEAYLPKISNRYREFSPLQPSEMASLSNSRRQNRKGRPNRSTNNDEIVEKDKRL